MPSAGAIQPPKISVLRDPHSLIPSQKIDSETYIEIVCDTPYTKIYFSTDGTKPNPFQIGVSGRESTFRYKAPFQLKEGKRTVKAIAISRDGLQESSVMSKTFQVDTARDDFNDDFSFIDSFDTTSTADSTTTASTASTIKNNKKNKKHANTSSQKKKNKTNDGKKKEKSHSRSQSPLANQQPSWIDPRASYPALGRGPNGQFIAWGDAQPGYPPVVPVTAGTIFYPSVNGRPFSAEPDVGFVTREMIKKLDEQRKMTVADVREAVREMTTPRQPPMPVPEYHPPRYPEPKACSAGNGNWREQLEHIYAHLIEHAQIDPDFRIAMGEPKLGRVLEADFVDGDEETLILTVSISRYGHTRKPGLKAVSKVATAFNKPAAKKEATPEVQQPIKAPSKPPSVVKQAPPAAKPIPTPAPTPATVQLPPAAPAPVQPAPIVQKDPEPYFVKEEYQQEGTLKPFQGFDAEKDAEILRNAMKGLGTNEDAITNVLAARSATQRVEIVKTFKTMFGKDLIAELKSELSGNYLTVCTGLCLPPADYDAHALKKAMKGLGTDEQALIEIICTRTNAQIQAFSAAFKRLYNNDLEKAIESDTSGHFKRLLISLLMANRDESTTYDQTKVEQDAQKLFDAGEQKKFGTDESRFNVILVSRSYPHLRAVFEAYKNLAKKDIEESLKSEMSGDLLQGMLAVVRCIKHKPSYFAKALQKSMKGLGTDDESLLRIVISRCEIDMVQIKEAFQTDFKQTLGEFIRDDTSGDFRNILLKLVAEESALAKKK